MRLTFYFSNALAKIKYKWPIGFFVILALIQLVSFPSAICSTTFHASSERSLHHCPLVALTIGTVFTLYQMSAVINERQSLNSSLECWLEYFLIGRIYSL